MPVRCEAPGRSATIPTYRKIQKSDALQQAVERLVRLYPDLTEAKLKAMLTRDRFPRLIDDVDEDAICFK